MIDSTPLDRTNSPYKAGVIKGIEIVKLDRLHVPDFEDVVGVSVRKVYLRKSAIRGRKGNGKGGRQHRMYLYSPTTWLKAKGFFDK